MYDSTCVWNNNHRILFCGGWVSKSSNMFYSYSCQNCQDCFACIGLRNKKYCIFNKQYSREEHEKFVPQIIEKIMETGILS